MTTPPPTIIDRKEIPLRDVTPHHVSSLLGPPDDNETQANYDAKVVAKMKTIQLLKKRARAGARKQIVMWMMEEASKHNLQVDGKMVQRIPQLKKWWRKGVIPDKQKRNIMYRILFRRYDLDVNWVIPLKRAIMKSNNLVYRIESPSSPADSAPTEPISTLQSGVHMATTIDDDDASSLTVGGNELRISPGCIGQLAVHSKTDLVKQLQNAANGTHGYGVFVSREPGTINETNRFKKRKKGVEFFCYKTAKAKRRDLRVSQVNNVASVLAEVSHDDDDFVVPIDGGLLATNSSHRDESSGTEKLDDGGQHQNRDAALKGEQILEHDTYRDNAGSNKEEDDEGSSSGVGWFDCKEEDEDDNEKNIGHNDRISGEDAACDVTVKSDLQPATSSFVKIMQPVWDAVCHSLRVRIWQGQSVTNER